MPRALIQPAVVCRHYVTESVDFEAHLTESVSSRPRLQSVTNSPGGHPLRGRIKYKSDALVELNGPVDEATGNPITSGTCEARLFDDRKDARLMQDASASDTVLNVSDARGFAPGDALYIELDDGTYDTLGVVSTDTAAKTVTVAGPGLTSAASATALLSTLIGAPIAMTTYGTPVVGKYDWGFRGTIPYDQAAMEVGLKLRIQIELDAGAGLRVRENLSAFVDGGT